MLTWLRKFILTTTNPLVAWISNVSWQVDRHLSEADKVSIKKMLKPGYVLITYSRGYLSNYLIPGKWSHGALYIGNGQIVEAIGKGVQIISVDDFLLDKDFVAICSPKFIKNPIPLRLVCDVALKQVGKGYDHDFEWSYSQQTHFYCFELVMWAYFQIVRPMPFKLRLIWGEETVLGDDFLKAKKHWDVIFCNRDGY